MVGRAADPTGGPDTSRRAAGALSRRGLPLPRPVVLANDDPDPSALGRVRRPRRPACGVDRGFGRRSSRRAVSPWIPHVRAGRTVATSPSLARRPIRCSGPTLERLVCGRSLSWNGSTCQTYDVFPGAAVCVALATHKQPLVAHSRPRGREPIDGGTLGEYVSPMSGSVAAFFDVDHTVLEINSGSRWVAYQWRKGAISVRDMARALRWRIEYKFGRLDFNDMTRRVLANYAGQPTKPVEAEIRHFFETEVATTICVEARERIAYHRAQGHAVALLTSATQYLSRAVADAVDIEHILSTEIGVSDGRFTGTVLEPQCYGPGKVLRAEAFASQHGISLDDSFFYSDSVSDLPMLERVGHPRVINPDPRLKRIAKERGWATETWRAPQPSPSSDGAQQRQGKWNVATRIRRYRRDP